MDSRKVAIRISTIFGVSRAQVSADPGSDPALDWATDVIESCRAETLKEAADRAVAWLADSTSGIDPALAATNSGKWLLKLREKQIATLRAAIMEEPK